MDLDSEEYIVPVSVAVVVKVPDISDAKDFLKAVANIVASTPGMKFIYRKVSPAKLWIREGGKLEDEEAAP